MTIGLIAAIIMSPILLVLVVVLVLCYGELKSANVRAKQVTLESSLLLDLLTEEKVGWRVTEKAIAEHGVYSTTCIITNEIGTVVAESTRRAAVESPPVSTIVLLEREARLDALKKVVSL